MHKRLMTSLLVALLLVACGRPDSPGDGAPDEPTPEAPTEEGNGPTITVFQITQHFYPEYLSITVEVEADDEDGFIEAGSVSFGDGTVAPLPLDAAPARLFHTYDSFGTYEVVVTVEDDDGRKASASRLFIQNQPDNALGVEGTWKFTVVTATDTFEVTAGVARAISGFLEGCLISNRGGPLTKYNLEGFTEDQKMYLTTVGGAVRLAATEMDFSFGSPAYYAEAAGTFTSSVRTPTRDNHGWFEGWRSFESKEQTCG